MGWFLKSTLLGCFFWGQLNGIAQEEVRMYNSGLAAMREGNLSLAKHRFQKARRFNPEAALPYFGLALVHLETEAWDVAITHFHESIQRSNDVSLKAESHALLALAYKQTGKIDSTVANYRMALTYRPDYDAVRFEWIEFLIELDDFMLAYNEFSSLTRAAQFSCEGLEKYVYLCNELELYEQGIERASLITQDCLDNGLTEVVGLNWTGFRQG